MKPTNITPAIDELIAEAERLASPNYHWGDGDRDALQRAIAGVKAERNRAGLGLPWRAEARGGQHVGLEVPAWQVKDARGRLICDCVTEAQARLIASSGLLADSVATILRANRDHVGNLMTGTPECHRKAEERLIAAWWVAK